MVKPKNKVHGTRKTKEPVNEYGLTAAQEAFCHAYLIRFSVKQAADMTGLKDGGKLMANSKVRDRINKIRIESGKAFDVTRERLLQTLMNLVYGEVFIHDGDDIVNWPEDDREAISGIKYNLLGGIEDIKRFDKLKAIELLNKMLGYNMPETSKHLLVNTEPMDPKEVVAIAKLLKEAV